MSSKRSLPKHAALAPERRCLLGQGNDAVILAILPAYQGPESPSHTTDSNYPYSLYQGCSALLKTGFKASLKMSIEGAVFSDFNNRDATQRACRVVCLLFEGEVVSALTYRINRHRIYGDAPMVRLQPVQPASPAPVSSLSQVHILF